MFCETCKILSIKTLFKRKQGVKYTLFKFPKSFDSGLNRSYFDEFSPLSRTFPDSPKIFLSIFPGFPEISRKFATAVRTQLRILHQGNQHLQLLRSESFEFLHDVCVVIQLQEPRVELHLLGKRESIYIAVSDIAVYGVAHTLGYVVMRNSGVSKVCRKGVSAPGTAWLNFPAHTLDKTTDMRD